MDSYQSALVLNKNNNVNHVYMSSSTSTTAHPYSIARRLVNSTKRLMLPQGTTTTVAATRYRHRRRHSDRWVASEHAVLHINSFFSERVSADAAAIGFGWKGREGRQWLTDTTMVWRCVNCQHARTRASICSMRRGRGPRVHRAPQNSLLHTICE